MSKKNTAAKGAALTAATSMVVFGMEQALTGDSVTGGIGITIAFALFGAYTYADEIGQQKQVNELVDTIGEDTLEELANVSADRLREVLQDFDGFESADQDQK